MSLRPFIAWILLISILLFIISFLALNILDCNSKYDGLIQGLNDAKSGTCNFFMKIKDISIFGFFIGSAISSFDYFFLDKYQN